MLLDWIKERIALFRINRFVKYATEEELNEWCRSILEEARHEAFVDKRYEDVDKISDLIDKLDKE